jgi:6-phosphogluconolactonase
LAESPLPGGVDWQRVHFFWGDERNVPADHPESNYRMAAEALLSRVPVPDANIHPIRGDGHPAEAADAYEADLDVFFAGSAGRFDMGLLGVGADGHTASLFPGYRIAGTDGDNEPPRRVVPVYADALGTWRITLTPEIINRAAQIVFLVSGAQKAPIIKEILDGPYRPERLPAQGIRPINGRLIWMLDEAAARLIDVEDGDDEPGY